MARALLEPQETRAQQAAQELELRLVAQVLRATQVVLVLTAQQETQAQQVTQVQVQLVEVPVLRVTRVALVPMVL